MPHYNVSLHASQRFEQVLQVLPSKCKWYPLHHHLQQHNHAFMLAFMLCEATQETLEQTFGFPTKTKCQPEHHATWKAASDPQQGIARYAFLAMVAQKGEVSGASKAFPVVWPTYCLHEEHGS